MGGQGRAPSEIANREAPSLPDVRSKTRNAQRRDLKLVSLTGQDESEPVFLGLALTEATGERDTFNEIRHDPLSTLRGGR